MRACACARARFSRRKVSSLWRVYLALACVRTCALLVCASVCVSVFLFGGNIQARDCSSPHQPQCEWAHAGHVLLLLALSPLYQRTGARRVCVREICFLLCVFCKRGVVCKCVCWCVMRVHTEITKHVRWLWVG